MGQLNSHYDSKYMTSGIESTGSFFIPFSLAALKQHTKSN